MAAYGIRMHQQWYLCYIALLGEHSDNYLFMNQQEGNINQKEPKNNRYLYPIVGIGFAFSIFVQWYAIAAIIFIWLVIALRDIWRMKQMEEVRRGMKDYSWSSIHELLKDSLEILKCRRMIERGYDSRANTNIILQEEKQQPISFKLSPSELAITNSIITISQRLYQLRLVKIEVFQQQQLSDIAMPPSQIESFRELFSMNREIDRLIEGLSILEYLFESRMRQPLLDPSPRHHLVRDCKSKILPLLAQIKQECLSLRTTIDKEMQGMKLTPQFQSYLSIIMNYSPSQAELQILTTKIRHVQEQNRIPEKSVTIQTNYISYTNEQASQLAKESTQEAQIERPSASQRRQFMKRLDGLLLVGLARRRQEQFQRKMRQLEQEQRPL